MKQNPVNFLLQMKELNHVLEAEKSCRTDLEMYVAVLNTQKSVLQEDAEKLRKELHDGTFFYTLYMDAMCCYLNFTTWCKELTFKKNVFLTPSCLKWYRDQAVFILKSKI